MGDRSHFGSRLRVGRMSQDEGAPVDPGLEPGYDEDLLVEEAASSQPASTVPATADSSHAGLRVGDSSAAGPALSAPESAPASASAEQLARLSNDVGWTVTGLTNVHGADALRPVLKWVQNIEEFVMRRRRRGR